jgi:N-acetylglucosaminyldiphosphoundecaprenol N-acetyl-beta-D-mannosaminyltransferase
MRSNNNFLKIIAPKLTDNLSEALKAGKLNTFLNPYSYLVARKNTLVFKDIDNIFVDGGLLQFILKALFIKKVNRLSFDFTSIADNVFKHCIQEKKSIFVVGSKENEVSEFYSRIKHKYPLLNILGYRNGYFNNNEKQEFSRNISHVEPDIIICGMGTPSQEELLVYLKSKGWHGTGFTCGGFIHQTASSKTILYYPKIVNKLNIRWIYRAIDEPKLLKRYLIFYPIALIMIIKDKALMR